MNEDTDPAAEDLPVPLNLLEDTPDVPPQRDAPEDRVGPWPYLASPGHSPPPTGHPHRSSATENRDTT